MKSYIREYLKAEVKLMRKAHHGKAFMGGWYTTGHFILKNGRLWPNIVAPLPEGVEHGRMKECFRNAANLALGFYRNEYIYCEGYAISIIPVMHAWCVDLQGNVIDPTWNNGTAVGSEYYGIAIKAMYLQERLVKQKHYGLIDAWVERWPMLTDKPDDWRHPVNDL